MQKTSCVTCCEPADYSVPGMRIRRFEDDAPWRLVVHSTSPQPDWQPVVRQSHGEHPPTPTTILYRGGEYWIHEVLEQSAGGWIYRMLPAPDNETHLRKFDLAPDALRVRAETARRARKEEALGEFAFAYEWLVGILPAGVQDALAKRLNFSPARASEWNALLMIPLGMVSMFFLAALFGALAGLFLGGLLVFESAARWSHCSQNDEPRGFLPLEIFYRAFVRLLGLEKPVPANPEREAGAAKTRELDLPGIPDYQSREPVPGPAAATSTEAPLAPLPEEPAAAQPSGQAPAPPEAPRTDAALSPQYQPRKIDGSIPGFRISLFSDDAPWRLVVYARRRQGDRWTPRGPVERGLPPSLGAAVEYDGAVYEVCEELRRGERWVYRMQPWPESDRWGKHFVLSAEETAREDAAEAAREVAVMQSQASWYHGITVGFLPAGILADLDRMLRFSFSPVGASRYNAAIELGVGVLMTVAFVAIRLDPGYGRSLLSKPPNYDKALMSATIVVALVALDGVARVIWIDRRRRACGPLPLELLNRLVLRIMGKSSEEPESV